MSGDLESSELGHAKYWPDYLGQTCNGSSTLPGSQKVLHNFEGTTFLPINAGAEYFPIKVGIFNQWT